TIRKVNRVDAGQPFEYGLGKLENVSSLLLACVFLIAATWIVQDAVERTRNPSLLEWQNITLAFVLNIVAIAIDGWLWRRNGALARAEYSPVMEAEARLYGIKTLSDILIAAVL